MNKILLISFLFVLYGCIPYPFRVNEPVKTEIIDAESGVPIEGALLLRISCDMHDHQCNNAILDRGQSDKNGQIKMEGKRKWMFFFPAPGGIPVPNYIIAIWKSGYKAFVYSQFGNINDIIFRSDREDLKKAIQGIPIERKEYGITDKPEKILFGGKIKLYRSEKLN